MAEMSIESGERGPEVAIQCIYLINGAAIAYWYLCKATSVLTFTNDIQD